MKSGEIFSEENIRSIRPGYGLPTKYFKEIIGKKALCNIDRGTPLQRDMITG
jgi:pseudaminic acid synthase